MPPAITALQTLQWGKETTRGTAVAATSKIAVEGIQFAADDEMARPRLAKGLLTSVPGDETVTRRGTTFSIPETPLVYDQHQHFLLGCVKGGVTSSPGTGAPETWTFLRSLTADPAPEARTLERRLSDGTNFIDNEWSYALFSQLRWIYAIDQPLRFSAEGFARRIQSSTLTAGQAMPTIAIPASPLAKIWIDEDGIIRKYTLAGTPKVVFLGLTLTLKATKTTEIGEIDTVEVRPPPAVMRLLEAAR